MVIALEPLDKSTDSGSDEQPVSIVIPCQAEYIGLCRLLAGVVGTRGLMHAEDIADLKLAVTEACTCFLWDPEDGSGTERADGKDEVPEALRIEFRTTPEEWQLTVCDAEHRHRLPGDSTGVACGSGGLGLTIMKALVDTVEHVHAEGEGSVIRLSKRIASRTDRLL